MSLLKFKAVAYLSMRFMLVFSAGRDVQGSNRNRNFIWKTKELKDLNSSKGRVCLFKNHLSPPICGGIEGGQA
jgi:hypothetical protein